MLRAFSLRQGGTRILEPVHHLAVIGVPAARGDGVSVGGRPTHLVPGDPRSVSAKGDGAVWRGQIPILIRARVPAIFSASPGEARGSRIAAVKATVQAHVKLGAGLSERES